MRVWTGCDDENWIGPVAKLFGCALKGREQATHTSVATPLESLNRDGIRAIANQLRPYVESQIYIYIYIYMCIYIYILEGKRVRLFMVLIRWIVSARGIPA